MARKFKTKEQFDRCCVEMHEFLRTKFELTDEEIDRVFYIPTGAGHTAEDILLELCGDPDYGNHN